jgi:hypothetical protein
MPVTYTNRKGHTYYLCQGTTKTGKRRYYFGREPKDESLDKIPDGYRISESVNGIVSLVKEQSQLILSDEIASVEGALDRHPKGQEYRVDVKKNQIIIYERLGPNVENLISMLSKFTLLPPDIVKKRTQEQLEKSARFSPILRFILTDPENREFIAERWSYLDDIDDWVYTGESGKMRDLARRLIPRLGTDRTFGG